MPLLTDARAVLSSSGYDTWLWQQKELIVLCFEDDSLIGFLHEFVTATDLIENWRRRESIVLTHFAPNLKTSAQKAWNVYSVFLTEDRCDRQLSRRVMRIDENFESTRKIARPHVAPSMVARALLPLMPIQAAVNLDINNSKDIFKQRLQAVAAPRLVDATLSESPPDQLAMIALGDEQ
jgi:hypothetical protein